MGVAKSGPEETYMRARLASALEGQDLTGPQAFEIIDKMMTEFFKDPNLTSVILDFLQEQQTGELETWATMHINLFSQASQFVRRAKLLDTASSLPAAMQEELEALRKTVEAIDELNKPRM